MTQLKDKRILVTRPGHQAQGLITLLSNKGASVLQFPTLVIHPVEDLPRLKAAIQEQLKADWFIFISPNAVDHAMPIVLEEKWLPKLQGQFATVGAGTRDTLATYGVNNILYPLNGVGALALLDALANEEVEHKQIAIFKGDSDNQTLEDGLAARGARLFPITCYQRKRTKDDPQPLVHALEHGHVDLVVTTSGDGLQSLVQLLPATLQHKLYGLPLVVVSDRVKTIAKNFGFTTVLLARDASDEAIYNAIADWHEQGASHD